ncbi:MAG: transcription antitermination factor NusB [Nitrospirae bacterium]|nr:MAG: transcription antitermination factor NusB [Nitrospirota bacterium]
MVGFSKQARRLARQRALQTLFQWEFQPAQRLAIPFAFEGQSCTEDERQYAERLVDGVLSHKSELDTIIGRYARGWTVERMPVVDRNILRCAIYELLWVPDVPAKVTINEAIELAKRFADEEAKRFINGVLDRILQEEPRLERKRFELVHEPRSRVVS